MTEANTGERKWDFDRVFRLVLTVATVVGLFALVRYLADVLIPFAVALLMAFLLNPVVTYLESRLKRRSGAVAITVVGAGVATILGLLLVAYVGGRELASVRDLLEQFVHAPTAEDVRGVRRAFDRFVAEQENEVVKGILEQVQAKLSKPDGESVELREKLEELSGRLTDPADRTTVERTGAWIAAREAKESDVAALLRRALRWIAPSLVGFFTGTLSFLLGMTGLIVVLLYLVFLLIDYPVMAHTWRGFLPPAYREEIIGFVEEFRLAMSRYFRGQFIIAMTVGVLSALGFKIIGLRMAILLGLGIGVLNMVPYLQAAGLIPALLLGMVRGLETGGSLWISMLSVLAVFAVVQVIQDALLTPSILGKSVGLRPVVLLLGLFIWGKLLGFLGLVLAIPLTCLGLAYYRRFVLGEASRAGDSGIRRR